MATTNWLTKKHPTYNRLSERWVYAWDQYTGAAFDPETIGTYLIKKEQRETDKMFAERKKLIEPMLHFGTLVDSLVGIMFANESDADRKWQGDDTNIGFGNPTDPDSLAYRLSHNADGMDVNWETIWKDAAIKLTALSRIWVLVEGIPRIDGRQVGEASVKLILPQDVTDWFYRGEQLTDVIVTERRDVRASIAEMPDIQPVYTHYSLEGWRRYRLDGANVVELEGGDYRYYRTQARLSGDHILPIFPVELPLSRDVGYLLARKQNAMMNMESTRDYAIRNISFALLMLAVAPKEWPDALKRLQEGQNALQIDPASNIPHSFLSPDASYLGEFNKTLLQKVKDYYEAGFKEYGDAAKAKTATQIRLESRSGIEAFLQLLVGSVDEAENGAMFRLSQVYFPDVPAIWHNASVKRSQEFQPVDVELVIERMKERYIGSRPLPVTADIMTDILQRILALDGFTVADEEQIKAVAETLVNRLGQEADAVSTVFGGL